MAKIQSQRAYQQMTKTRSMLRRGSLGLTLALTLFLFFSVSAHAGLWIQANGTVLRAQEEISSQIDTDSTRILGAGTVGYWLGQGLILGGQAVYSRHSQGETKSWGLGPKAGILIAGFELTAAYLLIAKDYEYYLGGVTERKGSGFAVNLGYSAKVAGPLRVGVYLMYWGMTFKEANGKALDPRPQVTFFSPLLSLGLHF